LPLHDQRRGGNRSLLTEAARREIANKLHTYRPVDLHLSQHEYWTVSDLMVAVEQWNGVVYNVEDSYHDLLRASGLTFSARQRSIATSRVLQRWRLLRRSLKKSDRLSARPSERTDFWAGRNEPVSASDHDPPVGTTRANAGRARQWAA